MTFTLEDAIQFATTAHKGQVDKAGEPYILHPLRVMFTFPSYRPKHRMVAVMHDAIEDSNFTYFDLKELGCPEDVAYAVAIMDSKAYFKEHPKLPFDIKYLEYVRNVATDSLAREVKIQDILDNLSMERMLRLPPEKQTMLYEKYTPALKILESV